MLTLHSQVSQLVDTEGGLLVAVQGGTTRNIKMRENKSINTYIDTLDSILLQGYKNDQVDNQ